MKKFFILGLPRSRTAWFSEYLGCTHEAIRHYTNYIDYINSESIGDSTTVYHHIKDYIEDYPKVFIHRPLIQASESLIKLFGFSPKELILWDRELKQGKGLHIDFDDINDSLELICSYISVPFDKNKNNMMSENIQNNKLIKEVQQCLGL